MTLLSEFFEIMGVFSTIFIFGLVIIFYGGKLYLYIDTRLIDKVNDIVDEREENKKKGRRSK